MQPIFQLVSKIERKHPSTLKVQDSKCHKAALTNQVLVSKCGDKQRSSKI